MDYNLFKNKLLELTGLDLNSYKEQQMHRRINQWISRHNLGDLRGLLELIKIDAGHRSKFLEYLTINTSNFFRDTQVFQIIETQVLPAVTDKSRFHIWSAGCSIGAEVYSIAMLLLEQGKKPAKLLATDLDEVILGKAKSGRYLPGQVSTVPKHLLDKYFRKEDNHFQLKDEVRQLVSFDRHNLLKDGYYKQMDLILCRNVFIYFTNDTQKRLTEQFVKSLNPSGYFIVGSAEQIMNPAMFGLKRVSYCIYQKA